MDKLGAVQEVQRRLGRYPAKALDTNGASEAGHVEAVIDEEELRIQSRGWHYNVRRNVELTPNGSDKIAVPAGVIDIDTDINSLSINVSQAGGFLYNHDDNDQTFSSSIRVRYTLRMDFACIPFQVRAWIVSAAAARYNERYGDVEKQAIFDRAESKDRSRALMFDSRVSDTNLLETSEAVRLKGNRNNWAKNFGA